MLKKIHSEDIKKLLQVKTIVHYTVVSFLLVMVGFLATQSAANPLDTWRETNTEKKALITLDNTTYPKEELIYDFYKISIPKYLWLEDSTSPYSSIYYMQNVLSPRDLIKIKEEFSWLSNFLNRDYNSANRHGIYRWEKEISISLGWPDQNELHIDGKHQEVFVSEIKKLLPLIQEMTGLKVAYIPKDQENIKIGHYGKVRIIPTFSFGQKSKFKSIRDNPKIFRQNTGGKSYESYLFSGVRFTAQSKTQVEGYFLPDSNNVIKFSVCKVYPNLKTDLLQSMVRECIIRSLGLPEMSTKNNTGILSKWNIANERFSKIYSLDGDEALEAITKADGSDDKNQNYVESIQNKNQEITEYDKFIVRLLYCEKLKPAMGTYEIFNTLIKSNLCIKTKENK